jgi:TRAP-type transport system periplasmic protein
MHMISRSLAILSVVSLLLSSGANAQQKKWDLANEYPATSIHAETADEFARLVTDKTGGEIKITSHHGGALGYKSLDQFDAVGDGALPLASSSFVFWTGIDPIFQLPSLPFVAPTIKDTRALYDVAKPSYERVLSKNNQILLFATPWPASGMWGNKPLNTDGSLKGLKIRTYDTSSTETMRNAGAFPVQVSWADVTAQLATNAIDAVLTSADGGVGVQMWELQKHFTEVNYAMPLQAVHINKDVWDSLSEKQQKAVLEASKQAEAFGWNLLEKRTAANYETMRKHGMTITQSVSPEYSQFLAKAAQPFIDKWTAATGEEAKRLLADYEVARKK